MGSFILAILVSIIILPSQVFAQSESSSSEVKVEDVKPEQPEASEQEAEATEEETKSSGERVEKLEVTGSFIRRTDIEGPSPIVVIDRQKIEASGMNSVGTVLRQSTLSPLGSGDFGNSGSNVNLKGLGSAKTLVLVNGQRAPGTGSSFRSGPVGTNIIPIAAVERIEVLKDGASATYGSDALGGVVNIITRKDIDGFGFANQYNMTGSNGSDVNRLSLAYGSQTSKSNFMTSLQGTFTQGDRLSDRDWAGLGFSSHRGRGTNYTADDSSVRAGVNCPTTNSSGQCLFDRSSYVFNEGYRADWVTQYTREVTSNTEFYSTLALGYNNYSTNRPLFLQTPGVGLGLSLTAAESPAAWNTLPGYSGGDTKIYHEFNDVVNNDLTQEYYVGVITGLKGYVGNSDWSWDFTLNNQINVETSTQENAGSFSGAKAAIVNGAYDPFNTAQRDSTGIGVDTFNRNRFMVNWAEFKTNGAVGNFWGFDWASAVGVSAAHFEYSDHRSAIFLANDAMGESGAIGGAGRELYAVFAEAGGITAENFELQFSLRGDFYSDFGETVNPKIASRYQPFKWLTFRTSLGTGFQAPTLQDMNASLEGFFNNFQDLVRCNPANGINDCDLKSTTASQATNPNLKEETSISFNFGTVVQPISNFTVGVDYWHVKVENVIGTAFGQALRLEDDFGAGILSKYGINIQRAGGSSTGEIERITYTLTNLGTQEAQGLDFDFKYTLKTSIGDFTFSDELAYMLHFYQEFVSEYGREDVLGRQGSPRWRNNFSVNYKKGRWGGQFMARSTADMLETGNINTKLESIPSPTQFDLMVSFDPETLGEFQIGVINIGNIRPRFSASQSMDTALFRPQETYYMTYRQDF